MKNLFLLLIFLLKEKVLGTDSKEPNGFLSQTKEYRAENDECVAENFNIALHYIILTLTNEFIVTFPHSPSDRKKRKKKINCKEGNM